MSRNTKINDSTFYEVAEKNIKNIQNVAKNFEETSETYETSELSEKFVDNIFRHLKKSPYMSLSFFALIMVLAVKAYNVVFRSLEQKIKPFTENKSIREAKIVIKANPEIAQWVFGNDSALKIYFMTGPENIKTLRDQYVELLLKTPNEPRNKYNETFGEPFDKTVNTITKKWHYESLREYQKVADRFYNSFYESNKKDFDYKLQQYHSIFPSIDVKTEYDRRVEESKEQKSEKIFNSFVEALTNFRKSPSQLTYNNFVDWWGTIVSKIILIQNDRLKYYFKTYNTL